MSGLDVENVCRLCCEKKGRLRSIFERSPNGTFQLQDVISDVARLEVELEDGLPDKICRTCVVTLLKMHKTIGKYRANDVKLRQLQCSKELLEVEIKEEEVDIEELEEICNQETIIESIDVKLEEEKTFLNYERLDYESEVSDEDPKRTEEAGSETDTADEAIQCMTNEKKAKQDTIPKRGPVPSKRSYYPRMGHIRRRYIDDDPDRPRRYDYKCYICKSDSHGTSAALVAHLNSCHIDVLPYTCPECVMDKVVIKTLLALNSHKRQHLNPLKCPHCDKRYTEKTNLTKHIELYHSGDDSQSCQTCNKCGEEYPSKASLRHHMKIHTTAATCEICGKVFKERNKLKRHIQSRHEKLRKYECHICKKKLSSMEAVHIHVKTFHSNHSFKCSYCSKTFGTEVSHRLHEKKHLDNPDFEPKKEWTKYYTVLEGESHNPKLGKRKKCNLCGMVTRNMVPHLENIHFRTEHRCHICDMVFKVKNTFNVHMFVHEHGKAHQCVICGRQFAERRHLIDHLRTKKHRKHPLALAMLSKIRKTTQTATKPEEINSDVEDESVQEEEDGIDIDINVDNFV